MISDECWDIGWCGPPLENPVKNQNEKNYEQIKSINMIT